MAKKRKIRPQSGVMRLTKQRLTEGGLPGPDGALIRYPRSEEAAQVGALLKRATEEIEQGYIDSIAAGQCGGWLLDGLSDTENLLEPLVRAAAAGRFVQAAAALTLPLVVQDKEGELVAALLAVPPGTVVSTVRQLPGYEQHALLAMLKYAKIKGVAVRKDAHGRGLGAALLKRCAQMYWQLDFMLLFGEFETSRALGPYYTRQGFTVLEPGQTTDVGTLLTGRPIGLGAGPGETFFYQWSP
ncbi:GNAT family N-acetyltransferase [Streptomyces aureus]|uniref:GNAT family N-acetyltransferase n=1 Tax=Streptomyces aureus TaxID=193461 RepID=A0ABV4SJM9_9ACTN